MYGSLSHPYGLMREGKVVKLFDALHRLGEWDEEGLPTIHSDKNSAPLISHQLWNVDFLKCTTTDCGLHLLQAGNRFLTKFLFEQAKTPVRGKLGVACDKKVQGDVLVTSCQNPPHEVGKDIQVLVLATAVITVPVHILLPQPIVLKVVVEIRNDGIGPLAAAVALINEVVDLPGDALHANPIDAHLPGDQKVQGPGHIGKEGRCTCWA